MPSWEYDFIYVSNVPRALVDDKEAANREEFMQLVNQAGAKGWRMKGGTFHHEYSGDWSCIIEREIRESELGVDGKVTQHTHASNLPIPGIKDDEDTVG